MKNLCLILTAILLSACSIQGLVEKTVPANVLEDHAAHIDKLLERDTARMVAAFDLDLEDTETQDKLEMILENVPTGDEIRRDYVGLNTSSSLSTSEGKSRNINLVSEVQTQTGFMTVTSDYTLDAQGECCIITNIYVQPFETSPMRETIETAKKVSKIIGIFFFITVLLILFLVIYLIRKKKKARA